MPSMKFEIYDDMKDFVAKTAEKQHTSGAEVIRRSLEAYRLLDEIRDSDGEVLLRRKDGTLERLVKF